MRTSLLPIAALVYLNALFTFENVPSTPALTLAPRLSFELLLIIMGLALAKALGFRLSRLAVGSLSVLLLLATLVRYVDVTAKGVLGREFDLYGDFPHLHRVFAMFWDALPWTTMVPVVAVVALVALVALALDWGAIRALERAFEASLPRRLALVAAPVAAAAFCLGGGGGFSTTVGGIVFRQVGNLRGGETARLAVDAVELPPEARASNLARLHGANVFVIFLESYGVTLIEDSQHYEAIAPRYRELEERLRGAGYVFASSQIQSPTFGGGSWRAHASLLSGVQVDSQHVYDALLASGRTTLVSVMREHGYRTVAAEPGIKWFWPDGLFYGFDKIYDFDALDYRGPSMGWWKIPDQFTLYRIYKDEVRGAKRPLFAKFSLIMTHIPYYPVPAYVADWSRFDDGTAFETGLHSVAHDAYKDLRELSSWYVDAFRYELDNLQGFLLDYVPENSLVIVLGDHQPPKLAMHDSGSWAVPIHVFSKRADLVRAFDALGFEPGLVPRSPNRLRMADFMACFLEIFDAREAN